MPEQIVQGNWGRNAPTKQQAVSPAANAPSPLSTNLGGILGGSSSGSTIAQQGAKEIASGGGGIINFNTPGLVNNGNKPTIPATPATDTTLRKPGELGSVDPQTAASLRSGGAVDSSGNFVPAPFNSTNPSQAGSSNPARSSQPAQPTAAQEIPQIQPNGTYETAQLNPTPQNQLANSAETPLATQYPGIKRGESIEAYNARMQQNMPQTIANNNSPSVLQHTPAPQQLNTTNSRADYNNNDPQGFTQWETQKGWAAPTANFQQSQVIKGQIIDSLNRNSALSVDQQIQELLNADPATTNGATMLQQGLAADFSVSDDPLLWVYLGRMSSRADTSFYQTMSQIQNGQDDISGIINGVLTDPSSAAGLMAKVAKQTEEQNLQANQADKDYLDEKFNIQMDQLNDQRADLEGYTKAKLYSMGAQDSSAGITLLSKTLHAADLTIQSAQSDYTHSRLQLTLNGTQIMNNYANTIQSYITDLNSQKATAAATYSDKLDEIDGQRITTENQKNQQKTAAIGQYVQQMANYQQQQKTFEMEQTKFAYQKVQDAKTNAINLSGMTGSIYMPGENGELIDTGLPTFEATKWQASNDIAQQQLSLSQDSNRQSMAFNLMSNYGSAASGTIEQLLGMKSGSLANVQTLGELQKTISLAGVKMNLLQYNSSVSGSNSVAQSLGLPTQPTISMSDLGIPGFDTPSSTYSPSSSYSTPDIHAAIPPTVTGIGSKGTLGGKYGVTPTEDSIQIDAQVGAVGGQCGHFVNDVIGKRIVGDSYEQKMSLTDPSIKIPSAGMVFVMPVKGSAAPYGHTGIVEGVDVQKGVAHVIDSNWSNTGDEKIRRHDISLSKISGYFVPPSEKNNYYNNPAIDAVKLNSSPTVTPSTAGAQMELSANQDGGVNIAFTGGINAAIPAFVGGTVTDVGKNNAGNFVTITDPHGTEHTYTNLNASLVTKGQQIAAGQSLGTQGNSGSDTGNHADVSTGYKVKLPDGSLADPHAYVANYQNIAKQTSAAIQYSTPPGTFMNSVSALLSAAFSANSYDSATHATVNSAYGLDNNYNATVNAIRFTPAQNTAYKNFALGDKSMYDALGDNKVAKQAFMLQYSTWTQQNPAYQPQVDNETQSAVHQAQTSLDGSTESKNYQVVHDSYQQFMGLYNKAINNDGALSSNDSSMMISLLKTMSGVGGNTSADFDLNNGPGAALANLSYGLYGMVHIDNLSRLNATAQTYYNQYRSEYVARAKAINEQYSPSTQKWNSGTGFSVNILPPLQTTSSFQSTPQIQMQYDASGNVVFH